MSNIKLVLTDIDGTLVWHARHDPNPAVKQAMEDVQNSGVQLIAATGRPYEMMNTLFKNVGFKGLGIFDGGATIRDVKSGEIVWKNWLDPKRLKDITTIFKPHAKLIDSFPTFREIPPEKINVEDITEPAPYGFAFVDSKYKQSTLDLLKEIPNISIHIGVGLPEFPGYVDFQITDVSSDKFHAVQALRKIMHSEKKETLAIGDSTNDLPLFMSAGLKIAMGNAMPELKAAADFIVGSVDQDGFAEAMNRFVLV